MLFVYLYLITTTQSNRLSLNLGLSLYHFDTAKIRNNLGEGKRNRLFNIPLTQA